MLDGEPELYERYTLVGRPDENIMLDIEACAVEAV